MGKMQLQVCGLWSGKYVGVAWSVLKFLHCIPWWIHRIRPIASGEARGARAPTNIFLATGLHGIKMKVSSNSLAVC